MPDSLLDIRDDAVEVTEGVAASIAAVQAALQTGTSTPAQLGALRAAFTGYLADIATIREDLDDLDVTDFRLYDDAAVTIRLWGWERDLRHTLVALAPKVRAAEKVAERLVAGAARQIHVVKAGETLQSIAAKYLGSFKEWHRIADANGLTPGALTSGTRLIIPPKR